MAHVSGSVAAQRMSFAVLLACSSRSPATTPPAAPAPAPVLDAVTTVEGYVIDSQTHDGVPGHVVFVAPDADGITDEHGHFRVEVTPGHASVEIVANGTTAAFEHVNARAHAATRIDLTLDHAARLAELAATPPPSCPHSAPGAVVEGHSTTQADVDDVAQAALQHVLDDPNAMRDQYLVASTAVISVQIELADHRQLSAAALPAGTSRFAARSRAELLAEANRTGKPASFIGFGHLYSDGTCAMVDVGPDFISPGDNRSGRLCCCTATDLYEKRDGRWTFVRHASESCA